MTTIHFKSGDFGATVALEMLPTLPVNNIRKLLCLVFSEPGTNCRALQTIQSWIPGTIVNSKYALDHAMAAYQDEYRAVPKGYRSPAATQQRMRNRSLKNEIKKQKTWQSRVLKFQSIFNETKEKYYA